MKVTGMCMALGAMLLSVNASAYFYDAGQHNSNRDVVTKRYKTKAIATPKYSPTQILCIKQRRRGSMVSENKCQTIAEWQQQMNEQAMRQYMLQSAGRSSGWELNQ